ncbi:MAG: PqqD family protein [Stigonema ocellatum SAG 48.90 = DSM 106950]|nr:PqqD family protein [Stigonema ocellatum SAG 48.90 = DSM 106950]
MSAFQSLTVTKDGFAFDATTGESFTLNRCGQLVLQRLRHGENRQQIVKFLCDRFEIAHTTAERDVADFYQQLNTLGLISNPSDYPQLRENPEPPSAPLIACA